ncbi:MAG: SDR family NAD(P)-dependent oxidoreductase [Devosia sp.]
MSGRITKAGLEGRVAVVTGGGRGIGRATALQLAEQGAVVLVGYNSDRETAEMLAATLPGTGHAALHMALHEYETLLAAARTVRERHGRLDILVNNGGATRPVPASDLDGLDDALFDSILAVNLRGVFSAVRALRQLLQVPDRSVIVNVSSIAARTGVGSNLAYCAAKAGVDALTIGLAKALAPKVRVLGVAPAGVDTGFVAGRGPADFAAMAQRVPLGKTTAPDDVARAILACITELTSSTGIIVPVDEGRHL